MKPPAPLSESHARALVEILQALEPDYRPGLRWEAMLYHARFGTPALSSTPRPALERAHRAADAAMRAQQAGLDAGALRQDLSPGSVDAFLSDLAAQPPSP